MSYHLLTYIYFSVLYLSLIYFLPSNISHLTKHCRSIEEHLFFIKSLHYGSKLSPQAKNIIDTLRDTGKLDTQAETQLRIMEKQIELLEEVDSSFGSSENIMSKTLNERRLEWRTLIAKVDTMVNQYNEIPSLLETFDRKYDDVGIWIQAVEHCQKQIELEQNIDALVKIREQLMVSFS